MIGTFGNIVFETSSERIRTFDGFARKGSAAFAEHAVVDDKPRLQHTGSGLDEISFSVRLDISLGLNPSDELEKFRDILAAGDAQKLIINGKVLGAFVLTELEESWSRVDNKGRLMVANLNISLKEYVSGY